MIKSIIALFIAGTLGVTGLAVAPKSVTKPVTQTAKKAVKKTTTTKAATSTTKAVTKASGALNGVKADAYYEEYGIPKPTKAPTVKAKTGGAISNETGRAKTKYVQGYYRKDGTYVQGYYRS